MLEPRVGPNGVCLVSSGVPGQYMQSSAALTAHRVRDDPPFCLLTFMTTKSLCVFSWVTILSNRHFDGTLFGLLGSPWLRPGSPLRPPLPPPMGSLARLLSVKDVVAAAAVSEAFYDAFRTLGCSMHGLDDNVTLGDFLHDGCKDCENDGGATDKACSRMQEFVPLCFPRKAFVSAWCTLCLPTDYLFLARIR